MPLMRVGDSGTKKNFWEEILKKKKQKKLPAHDRSLIQISRQLNYGLEGRIVCIVLVQKVESVQDRRVYISRLKVYKICKNDRAVRSVRFSMYLFI